MAKSSITIIGLGLTGASIGAALQRESVDFEIVGHDREPDQAAAAKKRGDVHRTEWNLHRACAGTSLLILAIPLNEVPETLELVEEDLATGAIVFCVSDVMQPVLDFAERALPSHLHFVAGHPILTGLGSLLEPRADLFEEIPFALGADAETDPAALELVNNVVERLGATPLYMDAAEHDGIVSLVEHLPRLLGAALVRSSVDAASWRDGKKLAGRQFAQSTDIGENGQDLARTLFVNRENVLRSIERFEEVLVQWKQFLSAEDEDALQKALTSTVEERIRWRQQAQLKDWDRVVEFVKDDQPGMLRQMFFGGLIGGRKRNSDDQ